MMSIRRGGEQNEYKKKGKDAPPGTLVLLTFLQ